MSTRKPFMLLALLVAVVAATSPILFDINLQTFGVSAIEYSTLLSGAVLSAWGTLVRNLNLLVAVVAATAGYILLKIWKLLFVPINVVRRIEDTGYIPDGKNSMKDVANNVRRRKNCEGLPPVFPNGWFEVLGSLDLDIGEVKYVCCLGEQLAVFRGKDGVVGILEAYCPHLGANLGVGGQVVGNCLQCPFHGWKFRGDGKCIEIPYSKTAVPEFAKTKSWPCLERNGSILLWYHAEGAEPNYIPQEIEEITSGVWTYRGITEHSINAHIEDIPENGADMSHFDHLHGSPVLAGTDLRYSFTSRWLNYMYHSWDATWVPLEGENKHVSQLTIAHHIHVLGFRIPFMDFYLNAKQIGPGVVNMYFDWIFGKGVMTHCVTPVEPLMQRMVHRIYCNSFMPTFIAKLLLLAECIQVERDIMIWNHKRYVSKPLLLKEDHLIGKHRRWYSQFYSENSPRYSTSSNNKLDW